MELVGHSPDGWHRPAGPAVLPVDCLDKKIHLQAVLGWEVPSQVYPHGFYAAVEALHRIGAVNVAPDLLRIFQEGEVTYPLAPQFPCPAWLLLSHYLTEFLKAMLPLFPILSLANPLEEPLGLAISFPRKVPLQISPQVYLAELMVGVREELLDDLINSLKVVGDEDENPVQPSVDRILKHLRPEGLVFPPTTNPEAQDALIPLQVDAQGHKKGDLLDFSLLCAHFGVVGIDEDGEEIGLKGLSLIEVEVLSDQHLSLGQGLLREGKPQPLEGALHLSSGVAIGQHGNEELLVVLVHPLLQSKHYLWICLKQFNWAQYGDNGMNF